MNECLSVVFLFSWFLWLFLFRIPVKKQHWTLQTVLHPRQIGNHLPWDTTVMNSLMLSWQILLLKVTRTLRNWGLVRTSQFNVVYPGSDFSMWYTLEVACANLLSFFPLGPEFGCACCVFAYTPGIVCPLYSK